MTSVSHKTPGQLIEDLLQSHGWTKRVLAIVLGLHESTVNKVISGDRPVDAELSLALGEVFGVPAERFLDLQTSYDLVQARFLQRPDPARITRAQLFGKLPVSEMIKRGWLGADDVRDVPKVEAALMHFFGASSLAEIEILPHAAKKTHVAAGTTPVQLAWLYRVKQIASEMLVPRFSIGALRQALPKLSAMLASTEAARHVPKILSECGVRFLLVEALPASKLDGVCFWLNDTSPVVALTMRFDRIDNFWFVLRHELEHVLCRHGSGGVMMDADLEGDRAGVSDGVPEEERVANAAAAEFCVPQKSMKQFMDRKAPFFAERDILGFARTLRLHPGLVAGQLQHRTKRYDRFRDHLVRIRSSVAPGAIVDGWGDVAPVGL